MTFQNLMAHNNRSPVRPNNAAQNIKVDGFMSELSSLVRGRLDHADSGEKWKWMQAERKLEAFENRNKIKAYVQLRLHDGADRCDLQEQIIGEYLLPQSEEQKAGGDYDPYDLLWAQSPLMNKRPITNTVLAKMAAGVPGFNVKEVAFEYKTHPDHVDAQLKEYVNRKALERADEVALGSVRKMGFAFSIEKLPETFFDFSPYKPRLTGEGDCCAVALGVAENKTYSAAVAAVADITQDGGGIRNIDLKEYLFSRCFIHEPVDAGVSLESLWNSDVIDVADAGVISVTLEGENSHIIGFRDGRMYAPDPVLVAQLYASAPVDDVWFHKSDEAVAMARAVKNKEAQMAVPVHEGTFMTQEEIEALEKSLVDSILSSLSERFGGGPEHIREVI